MENHTIPSDIEDAYRATVLTSGEALKYIHQPSGNAKAKVLKFAVPFYNLYVLTHHIPDVSTNLANGNANVKRELDKWFFSKDYSAKMLQNGMNLFSEYQKILLDMGVIKVGNK